MKRCSFDQVVFAVSRAQKKRGLALVFINSVGDPSVSGTVIPTFNKLVGVSGIGWRKIIGVYDDRATRKMIEDDLEFLGYVNA